MVLIVLAVILGVVIGTTFANRSGGPRPTLSVPLREERLARIRQLLGEGKKIEAVKELRAAQPRLRLKEAMALVDAIEAGYEPPVSNPERQPAGGSQELGLSPELLYRIQQLLEERKKIQAIKELRDARPGLGLKEAKELVEAIEGGYQPPVLDDPAPEPAPVAPPSALAERVRQLRDSGQETLAIRLVCDETGMGILDAQKFVQSLS